MTTAQREAVLHGEGPALVAAGPGSGKTFTITRRLLYLIQERKIPPQELLVITFTKEAAKAMQERFREQLTQTDMYRMNSKGFVCFATFHSYFYQIIKSIKKYSDYQLITLQEKHRIARPILKEYMEEVTDAEVNRFLSQVSYFKNTGNLPKYQVNTYEASDEGMKNGGLFQILLERYENRKSFYKRMDFDDMLYFCNKELMTDKGLLEYWQNRFSYVLVDEFQDSNPIQYDTLLLLTGVHRNLFVVGDDDQAIYGFRGSDTGIFRRFQEDFPEAVRILLVENFRCKGTIVEASKRVIEHNKDRVPKELRACDANALEGRIRMVKSVHTRECYEKLSQRLSNVDINILDEEAILFRTNTAMQMLAAQFNQKGIPFVLREKCESIYEHFLVKDINDFFLAAGGCRERSLFLRLFQKLHYILPREVLRTEQVNLEEIKETFRSGFYRNTRALETVESLERHLNRLAGMRLPLGVTYIRNALDYDGYLVRKAGKSNEVLEEWKQTLAWISEETADFRDFESWLVYQREYTNRVSRTEKKESEKKQGIHLLTLHASKGLEFKKVYIMNLNEGVLPQIRRGEEVTRERIEEERRLFYVGMTRGKEELELQYLTGTRENPRMKSRFLEELYGDGVEEL